MGYTTEFVGEFAVEPPLAGVHYAYLERFCRTRRMKREPKTLEAMRDPLREAVGLPVGTDGEYFVAARLQCGVDSDSSVVDYNQPPSPQPGLWCQWRPSPDGRTLAWDGIEKFYDYRPWLKYLIANMLKPWGYTVGGLVLWHGERWDDTGIIRVIRNDVVARQQHWDRADPGFWLAHFKGERRAS
ncbi:hypothetical protein ACFL59_07480 [Planctomycetota bacterium]